MFVAEVWVVESKVTVTYSTIVEVIHSSSVSDDEDDTADPELVGNSVRYKEPSNMDDDEDEEGVVVVVFVYLLTKLNGAAWTAEVAIANKTKEGNFIALYVKM